MLIRDWMTKNVISVTPETSMLKASKLMKENEIRRLPVVDGHDHVVGIVSDRDIKEASPSKATTLDAHELYYLLSELKVKSIMTRNPVTVTTEESVEKVALLMEEQGFGGIPVVDGQGVLSGIITDRDIYKMLIAFSGVRLGGIQLAFLLDDKPGMLCGILDAFRPHNANIVSVLTDVGEGGGKSHVFIRIQPLERAAEEALVEDFRKRFPNEFSYWMRDIAEA